MKRVKLAAFEEQPEQFGYLMSEEESNGTLMVCVDQNYREDFLDDGLREVPIEQVTILTRIFAYGTLIDDETRAEIIKAHRPIVAGKTIFGWEARDNAVYDRFRALVPSKDSVAHGVIFEVEDQELKRLDIYEGPGYQRVIFTDAGGDEMFQAYIPATLQLADL